MTLDQSHLLSLFPCLARIIPDGDSLSKSRGTQHEVVCEVRSAAMGCSRQTSVARRRGRERERERRLRVGCVLRKEVCFIRNWSCGGRNSITMLAICHFI
jgi:hypothetical protein